MTMCFDDFHFHCPRWIRDDTVLRWNRCDTINCSHNHHICCRWSCTVCRVSCVVWRLHLSFVCLVKYFCSDDENLTSSPLVFFLLLKMKKLHTHFVWMEAKAVSSVRQMNELIFNSSSHCESTREKEKEKRKYISNLSNLFVHFTLACCREGEREGERRSLLCYFTRTRVK